MPHSVALAQLEKAIQKLSYDERLFLIERLAHGLRHYPKNPGRSFEEALARMAADPQIQNEMAQIEREFAANESDELEQL